MKKNASTLPTVGMREAAEILGVNRETLRRWVNDGLPSAVGGGSVPVTKIEDRGKTAFRFRREDLASLAERGAAIDTSATVGMSDAARALGVSLRTVGRWLKHGLPASLGGGPFVVAFAVPDGTAGRRSARFHPAYLEQLAARIGELHNAEQHDES